MITEAPTGFSFQSFSTENPVSISYKTKNGQEIPLLKQYTSYDCGQTCLDMLSFEGKQLPKRRLTVADIWSETNARDITFFVADKEPLDYANPHMVLVQTGVDRYHWVIRVDDVVICPTRGIVPAKEYKNPLLTAIQIPKRN